MSENNSNQIKVFISYSWDSQEHQNWVLDLADNLQENDLKIIVDRKDLKYGGHIKTFMTKSIFEADIVLIVLTPNYKRKADDYIGGAGYEYNIINDDLFKKIQDNDKYIPIIRLGDFESSATAFLQGFNCLDLRVGENYERNYIELINQIKSKSITQHTENNQNIKIMNSEYKDFSILANEMNKKAEMYFKQLFVVEDSPMKKIKIISVFSDWEKKIDSYHKEFVQNFQPSKMSMFESYLEDFKNNYFGKKLWTVSSALKTSDPDLSRYKKDFKDAEADTIFETVNGILNKTHFYVDTIANKFNYNEIHNVKELEMEYLNSDEMFMNKIIGYGIRSEILHRYYPSNFPIMTQKSLWAMYFLCESAEEFITIEQKSRDELMRVSHNWQYPFDRFTLLMTVLHYQISILVKEYGIVLNPKYRFGYVNMFLSEIFEYHKADAKTLHEWATTN